MVLRTDFCCIIVPWTEAFVVSSCGRFLLFLQPTGGWITSESSTCAICAGDGWLGQDI